MISCTLRQAFFRAWLPCACPRLALSTNNSSLKSINTLLDTPQQMWEHVFQKHIRQNFKVLGEHINYSVQRVITRRCHPFWFLKKQARKKPRIRNFKSRKSTALVGQTFYWRVWRFQFKIELFFFSRTTRFKPLSNTARNAYFLKRSPIF